MLPDLAFDLQELVMEMRREYENSTCDGPDDCGVHGNFRPARQNLAPTVGVLVQVDSFQSVMANSRALLLPPMHANLPCAMGLTHAVQAAMHSYSHVLALQLGAEFAATGDPPAPAVPATDS
jgi:hypothetical protein